MEKKERKTKTSLCIDKDLKRKIKRRAVDEDKTLEHLVGELLKKAVEGDCDERKEE